MQKGPYTTLLLSNLCNSDFFTEENTLQFSMWHTRLL